MHMKKDQKLNHSSINEYIKKNSFDRKYWDANQNNKEIDIIIRRYLQDSDDDLRDSYSQYGSFKEELDEENQSNPMIKTIADELLKIVQRDEDEGGAKSGISIDFPLFYELTTGILKKYLQYETFTTKTTY